MGDSCGPIWAVDTEEMGLGVLIVLVVVAIPYLPVGIFAYWLGSCIWDVKIVKWGLTIFFVLAWHIFLVILKEKKGLHYSAMAVSAVWLLTDLVDANWHPLETHAVKWSIALFQ